jgi:hypothetical protein
MIPHLEINAIDDQRRSRQSIVDRNSMTANRTTITYILIITYIYLYQLPETHIYEHNLKAMIKILNFELKFSKSESNFLVKIKGSYKIVIFMNMIHKLRSKD